MRVHLETVLDVAGDTAVFAGRCFHQLVRSEAAHKMRTQVGGEFRVPLVAEYLHAAYDGGFVDAVALGQRTGGEEIRIFSVLENVADQPAAAGVQIRSRLLEASL